MLKGLQRLAEAQAKTCNNNHLDRRSKGQVTILYLKVQKQSTKIFSRSQKRKLQLCENFSFALVRTSLLLSQRYEASTKSVGETISLECPGNSSFHNFTVKIELPHAGEIEKEKWRVWRENFHPGAMVFQGGLLSCKGGQMI